MKIKLKNGKTGKLTGNVSVIFDKGDGYSYTVPVEDIEKSVPEKFKKTGVDNLELGNIGFNTNTNQCYICPEYIIALLEYVENKLDRVMWNINHEEYDSPFDNTANSFKLNNFEIQAYSWDDEVQQEYNFIYKTDKSKSNLPDIKISWYKYLGRDTTINQEIDSDVFIGIYDDIMEQLREFEKKELQKKGINYGGL